MKLTILRGLPGSGKSIFAKSHFQCCILENDQFQIQDGKYNWSPEGTRRAIALCLSITEQILSSKADVVVCNTFTKRSFIEGYKRLAEKYGADFEVIRMTGNFQNTHNVPKAIFDNMKSHFEDWPDEKLQAPDVL